MDAVDERLELGLQRLGRGDIRLDHELLDELVRIEAVGNDDLVDRAVGLQQDLALGQVEFQRLARDAAALQHRIGCPERFQRRLEDGTGDVVRRAVDRRLRLAVGELCRRLHHDAVEGVADLPPLGGEGHLAPRAPAGRRPLSASRGRWRCARAASARRGRGNRPNCRASAPRGRARSPGAHRRRRRRWRR